jgi:hypothetical protein
LAPHPAFLFLSRLPCGNPEPARLWAQPLEVDLGVVARATDRSFVLRLENLENRDTAPHDVGVRFLLDTFIGTNDGVPFLIPGSSELCDTQKRFDTAGPTTSSATVRFR